MKACRSISEHMATLPDYRINTPHKRHDFSEILTMALCGILSGCDDWVSIAYYCEEKQDWLKTWLSLPHGVPSHDTFNRVFSRIDPEAFLHCFIRWAQEHCPGLSDDVIAIDGKTVRGSAHKNGRSKAIHMVNAWVAEQQWVLGQLRTSEKSNEITAIPELLELLSIKGATVTIDAMGCQKAIAEKIVSKDANYVLAVKGNQEKLFEAIQEAFKGAGAIADEYQSPFELNGSRDEARSCRVITDLSQLSMAADWVKLSAIAEVETIRITAKHTSTEKRYFICSHQLTAEKLLRTIRSHWTIENQLHWTLDVAFGEDACQVKHARGAENLSRLRHIATNLLKRDKSIKVSMKNKRRKASWDDEYLRHLLTSQC